MDPKDFPKHNPYARIFNTYSSQRRAPIIISKNQNTTLNSNQQEDTIKMKRTDIEADNHTKTDKQS